MIVDDQRQVSRAPSWDDPAEYIRSVERWYRKDYWATQPTSLEVWSEKGTVGGVLKPVLDRFGVGFLVQKGFGSFTSVMNACAYSGATHVLYIGDHDPSGMHMSEVDLPARIERYGGEITIERIALHRSDCDMLPGFPASDKKGDPRYRWYVEHHGDQCWELDAMDPNDLRRRVEVEIAARIDQDAWNRSAAIEQAEKSSMKIALAEWRKSLEA